MSLKITLKADERLILSGAVIRNGKNKTELIIENNIPILREKDILRLQDADTPCKKLYFTIQLMYVDDMNLAEHHNIYWEISREVAAAAPSMAGFITQISNLIVEGKYYHALKIARKLIAYEQEVMKHAQKPDRGLQERAEGDSVRQRT